MILDTAMRLVGLLNGSNKTSKKISSECVENHHKDTQLTKRLVTDHTGAAAGVKQPEKEQEGASTQNQAGSSLSAQREKRKPNRKFASSEQLPLPTCPLPAPPRGVTPLPKHCCFGM